MKKVARVLAVGGVSAIAAVTVAMLPGTASANTDCSGENTQVITVAGVTVAAQNPTNSSGGLSNGQATAAAGACVFESDTPGIFTGGTVETGVSTNKGVLWGGGGPGVSTGGTPPCWGTGFPCPEVPVVSGIPGVYVIAQGQQGNTLEGLTTELQGYIGVSNFEAPSSTGHSSNSGGAIALLGIGVYNVPSPLVCGQTSGNNWSDTDRQGCQIP